MNNLQLSRRSFLVGLGACACGSAVAEGTQESVRFGAVSDIHFADLATSETRYYRESNTKLQRAVASMNAHHLDFAIELGDFKDHSGTKDATLASLRTIEGVFAGFNGARYHVLGNHDVDCLAKSDFLGQVTNTGIDARESYYSFAKKGITFIVLDADFSADQDNAPLTNGGTNWKNSYVPPTERTWLADTLASAPGPAIVFSHQRLDPAASADHAVNNAAEVRSILQRSNKVAGVFGGHAHVEGSYNAGGINYWALPALVDRPAAEGAVYHEVTCRADGCLTVTRFRV